MMSSDGELGLVLVNDVYSDCDLCVALVNDDQ